MAKKILLADDSITIQKVVELTFSDGDYEIIAVNNGSKAIEKLQETRPDVILSDIIMPEKNGYEVCEFVKSHPDLKSIPVILLTGTFEPFDPDRAERAGCDAVVTKPFESQSLIHKVEELIQQAGPEAAAPAVEPSPFDETHAERREPAQAAPAAGEDEPFAEPSHPSPDQIFGMDEGVPAAAAPPDRSGSVFDETNPPRPAGHDASAFGDTAAAPEPVAEEPAPQAEETAPQWSAETTAFPKMSFDDLQRMRDEAAAAPEPEPPAAAAEGLSWPQPSAPEPQPPAPEGLEWPQAAPPAEPEEEAPTADAAPLGGAPEATPQPAGFGFQPPESGGAGFEPPEPPSFTPPEAEPEPAFSGETTAFPKMSFDDLQRMREEAAAPAPPNELPWASAPEPLIGPSAEDAISASGESPATAPAPQEAVPSPLPESAPAEAAAPAGSLSDADVDRIARRVVELISDKAVRDIAWEVIPDLAQAIVRDRIRELETEA